MKLYHGSNIQINAIDLSLSKPNKDFGRAFYLSPDVEQAEEMADFKAELLGGIDVVYGPIANDRIGAQITRLQQGYITFAEFLERIKYIKGITFQYAFCTQKAVNKLKFST